MRFRPTVVLLLASCVPALARAETFDLKLVTLSPKKRLTLPYLRVAVGPDRPLALRGRAAPVTFAIRKGELVVDTDLEPGPETPIDPGKPVEVLLTAGRRRLSRHLLFLRGDPGRGEPTWSVVSLDALKGKIGPVRATFLDHDADGTFLTPHRDFLVSGKDRIPHPVAPTLLLGKHVWRLTVDETSRKITAERERKFIVPEIFPRWTEVADGIAYLNEVRGGMNLPPVSLSREASRHAMLHVHYLERNGGNGHIERRDFPGYTDEGLQAGLNSIGHLGPGSIRAAIDGHLGSLLHRIELIDPRTTEMGVAAAGNRIWIHTEWGEKRPWKGQGPVIFPGPSRRWSIGSYSTENPDPRPETTRGPSGLPVTVSWFAFDSISEVRVDLTSRGRRPRYWKNDADGRDLSTNHGSLRAVIMTRDTLRDGSHVLSLRWKRDGRPCRLEHEFRIGR